MRHGDCLSCGSHVPTRQRRYAPTMQLINYFVESLWAFTLRLVGCVLCIWIIMQALRSLFGGFRK